MKISLVSRVPMYVPVPSLASRQLSLLSESCPTKSPPKKLTLTHKREADRSSLQNHCAIGKCLRFPCSYRIPLCKSSFQEHLPRCTFYPWVMLMCVCVEGANLLWTQQRHSEILPGVAIMKGKTFKLLLDGDFLRMGLSRWLLFWVPTLISAFQDQQYLSIPWEHGSSFWDAVWWVSWSVYPIAGQPECAYMTSTWLHGILSRGHAPAADSSELRKDISYFLGMGSRASGPSLLSEFHELFSAIWKASFLN